MSMFPFRVAEPNQTGQLTRWDIPINRWLDVKFDEGLSSRAGDALSRMSEDFFSGGPTISADEANQMYGLEGLKFDSPINEDRARLMNARKQAELTRMAYMETATHSWFSAKAAAGLGTSMFASMLHPVDIGLMFLPIVGEEAKAAGIAKLGGGALRQGLARGLVTEETLAQATRFPRFTAAFIEGTVGNAVAEVPQFIQSVRDQAVYGPEDAVFNVLAGGLFASGVKLALSGLGHALEAAAFFHRSLTPEIKDLMVKKAVDDFARGRDIKVDDYVKLDENAIAGRVQFDEAKARQEAEAQVPMDHVSPKLEDGTPVPNLKVALLDHPGETREMLPQSVHKTEVEAETALNKLNPNEDAVYRKVGNEFAVYRWPEAIQAEKDTAATGNGLVAARQQAVTEAVAKKRADFEAQKGTLIEKERQAEIQRQIAAGKILPEKEVERMKLKGETADSTDAAIISEDLASVNEQLKADTERRLAELTPEERESVQAQLDEEVNRAMEDAYQPKDKAVEAAVPCVIEGAING